jgi:Holliday junction resolvase
MAVNSRAKGARGEIGVRDLLCKASGLDFQRTPGSGSGKIKGDLHLVGRKNTFCIEVKNYEESPLNDKVFTSKTNNLVVWWTKLIQQATACGQEPLLFFKYNRSKVFVVTRQKPVVVEMFLYISWLKCYTMLSEEWLSKERIIWQN